jgi:hypothetical protein
MDHPTKQNKGLAYRALRNHKGDQTLGLFNPIFKTTRHSQYSTNISMVIHRPGPPFTAMQEPAPPEIVKGEEEKGVECMGDSKPFRRQFQYLVKWEGYDTPSWEPRA